MPALIIHAHHGSAGTIGILKVVEDSPGQGELHRDRMLLQEVFYGVMIGVVAKFAFDDPHNFAIMDGRVEVFEIQHIASDGLREGVELAAGLGRTLIEQAEHALLEKPARFLTNRGAFDTSLLAARTDMLGEQDDRADNFVVKLQGISEQQL
jgi:hypothetical protein